MIYRLKSNYTPKLFNVFSTHIYVYLYTYIYILYIFMCIIHTHVNVWGSNKCIQKGWDTHKSLTVIAYGKEPRMGE